jgi:hypothetical protein
MRYLPFVILVLALAIAVPAHAQLQDITRATGNDLYPLCQSTDKEDIAFCHGYILGFVHGLIALGSEERRESLSIPSGITGQQVVDIIVKYLKNHPEFRHLHADVLIFSALLDAFPPKVARSEN